MQRKWEGYKKADKKVIKCMIKNLTESLNHKNRRIAEFLAEKNMLETHISVLKDLLADNTEKEQGGQND